MPGFWSASRSREVEYQEWYEKNKPSEEELARQRKKKWKEPVTISVLVPAYRTPEVFLRQMIESVLNQTYPHLELCIADGSGENISVEKVVRSTRQRIRESVTSVLRKTRALQATPTRRSGWPQAIIWPFSTTTIFWLPTPFLRWLPRLKKDKADVVYTDEDKVTSDLKEHFQPHFKPDFNPDLLCSNNYICHLFVVKRSLALKLGWPGSQPTTGSGLLFYLPLLRKRRKSIVHIAKILYHWRVHQASTADNPTSKMYAFDAGKRAIEAHLQQDRGEAEVSHTKVLGFYRVKYQVQEIRRYPS